MQSTFTALNIEPDDDSDDEIDDTKEIQVHIKLKLTPPTTTLMWS